MAFCSMCEARATHEVYFIVEEGRENIRHACDDHLNDVCVTSEAERENDVHLNGDAVAYGKVNTRLIQA